MKKPRVLFDRPHGFTMLELMVILFIMAILSYAALQTVPLLLGKVRDTRRIDSLATMRRVLEIYRADTGQYPATSAVTPPNAYLATDNTNAADLTMGGTTVTNDYIPGITPGYYSQLPVDPLPGPSTDASVCGPLGYTRTLAYISDGNNYKLIYECAGEATTIVPSDDFADPGRCLATCWAWSVSNDTAATQNW